MVAFGALSGGVGAELSGGNFWQGAVTGGIVAGLNHAMHMEKTAVEPDPPVEDDFWTKLANFISGGAVDEAREILAIDKMHAPGSTEKIGAMMAISLRNSTNETFGARGTSGFGNYRGKIGGMNYSKVGKTTYPLVKTGIQWSKHALQRASERGISKKMVELAINKGQKFYDPHNKSINYVLPNGFASGKSLLVGTNPITGQVTTVIRSSKNLINSRFISIK